MPIIYVHLNFQTEVNLLDDNFTYKEWTNKKLADERKKYNRPNKGIWLELNDDETSAESYPVAITESEIYEGDMAIERNDRSFFFNVDINCLPFLEFINSNPNLYPIFILFDFE